MVKIGRNISINDVCAVAFGTKVSFLKGILRKLDKNYKKVLNIADGDLPVYGVNTGFGSLARIRIEASKLKDLQRNLILSHCAGIGDPLPVEIVRAAMLIRINTLIKGNSGVRSRTVKLLADMLNRQVHPIVPSQGSVGASGDLAPTAAIAAVMIGKGKAIYKAKVYSGRKALSITGLKPIVFGPKEGLALLNGTQFMSAAGSVGLKRLENLQKHCDLAGVISIEALRGTAQAFNKDFIKLRPHPGMILVSRNIRKLIRGSRILSSHRRCNKVQDPYSLRCIPQIHGAARESFLFAVSILEREINSVTDNPVFVPEVNAFISGGHFHGQPLAMIYDFLLISISYLTSISERRIARLLDYKNSDLPPHLAINPGINSGLMILQLTAASLAAENRNLANPISIASIPTSANQEDLVSMGMNSGLKFLKALDNLKKILAIEILCGLQGIDFLRPLKSSVHIERIYNIVRRHVPFIKADHELTDYIEKIVELIDRGEIIRGIKLV